ncbi:MAG: AAA family ATPase [Bacteroidota bacterium]
MISVQKDYDHPPAVLRSADTHAAVLQLLRNRQAMGVLRLDILMHQELLEALLEVYNGKCAITERKISLADSTVFLTHYRPANPYYWLAFEWSNLMPVSDDSTLFRDEEFPLRRVSRRILSPPEDRALWRADADLMQQEESLLIHPELDQPEEFIYFDLEGVAQAVNQNQRGTETIDHYTLNYGQVVVERKKKIQHFQQLFAEQVTAYKKVYVETTPNDAAMNEFFHEHLEALVKAAQPDAEFSLLGQNMIRNFDYYIADTLERAKDRRILRNAFESFSNKNLSNSPIKIAQTEIVKDEKQEFIFLGFELHQMKCFEHLKFDFTPNENLHLITGTNGTGKSSILQLLGLILCGLQRPPLAYGWGHVVRNRNEANEVKAKLRFRLNKREMNFTFYFNTAYGMECRQHRAYYESLRAQSLVLGYGVSESQPRFITGRYQAFSPIATLFGDTSFLHTLNEDEVFYLVAGKFDTICDLMNPLLCCAYENEDIKLVDYDRDHFYFETSRGRTQDLDMPRSFRAIFDYLLDMLFRFDRDEKDLTKPEEIVALVLIDELDQILSLNWQRTLFQKLAEQFPKVNFLVTTQNPYVIQELQHNGILLLNPDIEKTTGEPFINEGKAWAWTTTQIMARLLNTVTEISPIMDAKLAELNRLIAEEKSDTEEYNALRAEIESALPPQSPYWAYLEGLG